MAKNIERLSSGQAPSLLDASKGNELIDAINTLRNSKSTGSAEVAGIVLKTSAEGALQLDVTSDFMEKLNPQSDDNETQADSGGGGGGLNFETGSITLTTVINGRYENITFVTVA